MKFLTKGGVKFQRSKFIGVGRIATKEDLISSIVACDRIVVVDITEFPSVRFIPLDTPRLVGTAHSDQLTVKGWSRDELNEWVNTTYEVSDLALAV